MDITPQDLDPDHCAHLLRRRGPAKSRPNEASSFPARQSWAAVGAVVGGPLGMLLGIPAMMVLNLLHVHAGDGAFFIGAWALGIGGSCGLGYKHGSAIDRRNEGEASVRVVTAQEITRIAKGEKDTLRRDYLNAVAAAVALPPPHEESARHSIREAVRSLGRAVGQVPPPRAAADVGALRAEAGRLVAQARDEPDSVIAASLTRQGEAFGRRADTAARVAVLVRRGQTLRAEVAAQVQAFQAALTAAQINGGHGGDFAALAASVAQVMQEADALADAQAELEAALTPAAPAPEQNAAAQSVPLKAG